MPATDPTAAAGDVCMFVASPLRHDTRVEKEAACLAEAGHRVRIVASLHPDLPRIEERAGATVVRVDDDPLPARIVRGLLRRRAGGDAARAAPGAVITRESVERRGARARLLTAALRVHLRLAWYRYLRNALRAARERPARLWVAHDLDTLPVALRARRLMGGRVLYDSHELFVDSSLARGERRRWERLERALIGRADAVTTVSPSIARTLASRYGIREPRLLLNAPPAARRDDERPAVDLRRELSLPAGARVALYLGGIQQHRGLEPLIAAAAARDDLALVLLGPGTGSYRAQLERAAAEHGVTDRVRFMAPVPPQEIVRHARAADVGVAPIQATYLSYRYALPNKLFDYLQAGLPLVVSDFPDMAELVARHDVGAVCDPSRPASIAEAIDAVTRDPERAARLRANALRAAEDYTWERQRETLLELAAALT